MVLVLIFNNNNTDKSDKGHLDELNVLYDFMSGKRLNWPIDLNQIIETTEATFTISSN